MVSNVTGEKLPLLRQFLNVLPSSQMDDKYVVDAPFEFQISDVFSVPFVGTVVVCPCFSSHLSILTIRAG
jgi:GTPase